MMTLKPPSSFFAPPSPINIKKHNKALYTVFSYLQSPPVNLLSRLFTCPQAELTPHFSLNTLRSTFLKQIVPSDICYDDTKYYQVPSEKQEVQWLQTFAFPVETVHDEHAKSRFRRDLRGQI